MRNQTYVFCVSTGTFYSSFELAQLGTVRNTCVSCFVWQSTLGKAAHLHSATDKRINLEKNDKLLSRAGGHDV